MQKRLVRKLDLERFLSQVEANPSPKASLEQYTIPTDVEATMLYIAAYVNDDIIGKSVLDLGCGTGRLALGAAFLGAKETIGVDLDKDAVKVALQNSEKTGLRGKTQWVASDINAVNGRFDTALENPPFGVQRRGADIAFLEKALAMGRMVYSLHKSIISDKTVVGDSKRAGAGFVCSSPSAFLERFIEQRNGHIKAVYSLMMTVPHMFGFHEKKRHEFPVDLFVIEARKD
jgi:putative methylase